MDEAQKKLFSQKVRPMDDLPPTRAALVEHAKRTANQAGHVWTQMSVAVPKLPSPRKWGWLETNSGWWEVKWTALPDVSHAGLEQLLLRCGRKKGCR